MTVRAWQPSDKTALIEMARQFMMTTSYSQFIVADDEAIERLISRIFDGPDMAGFVLADHDVPCGMIALVIGAHPISQQRIAGELCWWVNPDARSSHGGLALLRRAETWARDHQAQRLQMVAPTDRIAELYRRLGFDFVEYVYQKDL